MRSTNSTALLLRFILDIYFCLFIGYTAHRVSKVEKNMVTTKQLEQAQIKCTVHELMEK